MYPGSIARIAPDRPATVLAETGETITYRELDARSARLATLLRAHGLDDGDTVVVLLDNDVRWGDACWACWRTGFVLAAVDHHLSARELAPILAEAAPRAVVTTRTLLPTVAAALGPDTDDVLRLVTDGPTTGSLVTGSLVTDGGLEPATGAVVDLDVVLATGPRDPDLPERAGGRLLFSSGTTGAPKPARVAPRAEHPDDVGVRSAALMRTLGFTLPDENPIDHRLPDPGDVLLLPGPAHHAGPLGFLQSVHQSGGTVVLMRRFDAAGALAAIERHRVTHSQWVPTMFVRLLRLPSEERERYDLGSHRAAIHAAAPCPAPVKQAVLDWWGAIVHEYYGASEGYGRTVIGPHEWLSHPGSVGRAVACRIAVADAEGRALPPGEVGAVWFASESTPDPAPDDDLGATPGWGTFSDLGRLDDDGYLYLTGRAGQTIITGGVNVYPREVEDLLAAHPDVDDVAVIGVPDAEYGERVTAVVVPRPGAQARAADLVAWCRERLAHVKCPRAVEIVDRLPRNDTGKLRHRVLRERFAGVSPPGEDA